MGRYQNSGGCSAGVFLLKGSGQMTEAAQYLESALTRACRELAEGDSKPSYSINGQSVQWTEYRRHLLEEVERLKALIEVIDDDADGGIVIEVTQYIP